MNEKMHIWVDADACPVIIKEIIYKAAQRTQITATFVANRQLRVPPSPYIHTQVVMHGLDAADHWIIAKLQAGDLVITADIPLAAAAVSKQAHALNPRGERYTADNIHERLSMRNFMTELRANGVETGGPDALNHANRQLFAASLDRLLGQFSNK